MSTPHDLVRRIAASAGGLALVVGPPLLLSTLVGNPLPESLPTLAEIGDAFTDGRVAERTLLKALALVCWTTWVQIVLALGIETVRVLGRESLPSVPVIGAIRSLAVLIVAGVWLSTSSDAARAAALPPLPTADSIHHDPDPAERQAAAEQPEGSPGRPEPSTAEGSATQPTPVSRGADESPGSREYVVQHRDSLWSIAGSELGDPQRWPEILELNRGRSQPDGSRLEDPGDAIHPGWVLHLPGRAAPGEERRVTVQAGDTLWELAEEHLGDGTRWNELFDANRSDEGGPIRDADLIMPDWVLTIPTPLPGDGDLPADVDPANSPAEARGETGRQDSAPSADRIDDDATAADAEARDALERLQRLVRDDAEPVPAPQEPEVDPGAGTGAIGDRTPSPDERRDVGDHAEDDPGENPEHGTRAPGGANEVEENPLPQAEPAAPASSSEGEEPQQKGGAVDDPLPEAPLPMSDDDAGRRLRLPAAETWPDRREPPIHDVEDAESIAFESRPGSMTGALAGASIFAAGLAWTVTRLRRAQERWRNANAPVEGVAASSVKGRAEVETEATVEIGVRQAADPDLLEFLDRTLRTFSARLRDQDRVPPPIVGVNVAAELSILFAKPDADPVDGFAVEDDGFSWVIDVGADLPPGPEADNPLPALFTLGHTEHSQVLLNPEAANSIAVRGSSLDVQEALFTMAVELATGPWAGALRVVCIGFAHELRGLDHVDVVESPSEVIPLLEEAAEVASRMCQVHDVASAVDARISRVGGDASEPTVVLCAAHISAGEVERVVQIAHRSVRSGVTAIVAGNHSTTWRLDVAGDEVELLPMRVRLARHHLDDEQRRALGRLLEKASRIRALNVAPRSPEIPHAPSGTPALDLDRLEDEPSAEVRVLGTVEVEGRAADFRRRKPLELIAYLAMHRAGVESDVLMEALWPDRLVAPGTLHSTTSLARRCLGTDASGAPYLPHVGPDGLYRVSDALSLDYDRFRAYGRRARGHEGPNARAHAIADLGAALSLVRGRPFSATGSEYLWTHGEALVTAVVAEITDAAHELACLYLDANDHRGAWWATRQGLLASPGNEQLHRDRMLAADLAGNPAGVEEVMEELCRAIEIDGDEIHDVLHPLTLEVYEQLTRRPRPRSHA